MRARTLFYSRLKCSNKFTHEFWSELFGAHVSNTHTSTHFCGTMFYNVENVRHELKLMGSNVCVYLCVCVPCLLAYPARVQYVLTTSIERVLLQLNTNYGSTVIEKPCKSAHRNSARLMFLLFFSLVYVVREKFPFSFEPVVCFQRKKEVEDERRTNPPNKQCERMQIFLSTNNVA